MRALAFLGLTVVAGFVRADPGAGPETLQALPAFVVTATRESWPLARTPLVVDVFSADDLGAAGGATLDTALRTSPAFSLFRRSDSLAAHPTAQGVSLRGLGPSGASRALVLLDGVPLNDPFGGWVTWTKVPRLNLAGAEIVHGGGSGVWGNAALGGVVQMLTSPPAAGTGAVAAAVGERGTRHGEAFAALGAGPGATVEVGGRLFSTGGHRPLSGAQSGAVDRPLEARHALLHASAAVALRSGWRLELAGRWFEEDRLNGTAGQRNASRETFGRWALNGPLSPSVSLELLAYAQRGHFASTYTSVNPARTVETPSLDQFDVPATAFGGAAVVHWQDERGGAGTAGFDWRTVAGETREDFLAGTGGFQRRRAAGGSQRWLGTFLSRAQPLTARLDAMIALRADAWANTGGFRRETVKATGQSVRDERYPGRRGGQISPGAGLVWRITDAWRGRVSAYRAFRLPTLNEYYRPFRVGSVATEANPSLHLETVTGGEAGLTWQRGRWEVSGTGYRTALHDAVANVTLSSSPTLTQRQRRNLDRVDVLGAEARVAWTPGAGAQVVLAYLHADASVGAAAAAPSLVGRRSAQVPRHTATLHAQWTPARDWTVRLGGRAVSRQFEDDENRLRLAPSLVADAAVTWRLAPGRTVVLAVDNLGGARTETGRSADGLVTLGAPRTVRLDFVQRW